METAKTGLLKSVLRRGTKYGDNSKSLQSKSTRRKSVDICPIILIRSIRTNGETSDSLDYLKSHVSTPRRKAKLTARRVQGKDPIAVEGGETSPGKTPFDIEYERALEDAADATVLLRRLSSDPKHIEPDVRIKQSLVASLRKISKRGQRQGSMQCDFKEVDYNSVGAQRLQQRVNQVTKPPTDTDFLVGGSFSDAWDETEEIIKNHQFEQWTPFTVNGSFPFNFPEDTTNPGRRRAPSLGNKHTGELNVVIRDNMFVQTNAKYSKPQFEEMPFEILSEFSLNH